MADIKLSITTPTGKFFDGKVDIVTVTTTEGQIGLQAGKSPFVASLAFSELMLYSSKNPKHKVCAIDGGVVVADPKHVEIITDSIIYKEDIDLQAEQRAKEAAEQKLRSQKDNAEIAKLQVAIKKAINRIQVKGLN